MGEKASAVKDEETEVKVEFGFGSVEEKREKIQQACRDRDLNMIANLALSTDGLLADDIRQEVCELSPHSFPTPYVLWLEGPVNLSEFGSSNAAKFRASLSRVRTFHTGRD